jgi:hypothetical protein
LGLTHYSPEPKTAQESLMGAYTNFSDIPLSIAVWLATDHYDHDPDPNHISATSLLKSTRQIVLSSRIVPEDNPIDLESLVASRMGTAIHDSIEKAWTKEHRIQALRALNYPDKIINKIKFNPKPEELEPDDIPVYMEQRLEKEVMGIRVSGKFDFIAEGRLEDFKSTSTFSWMSGNNDEKYRMQGSIYRWLNPDIITQDEMVIQFIFTDWNKARAISEQAKGYPQKRTQMKRYPLYSYAETDMWVKRKIGDILKYKDAPDSELPFCTDEELWRTDPQYKYYKNPNSTARSTKNFTNLAEAQLRMAQDGNVGTIKIVPGQVKACQYCPAVSICGQAKQLVAEGSLII